MLLHVRHAVRSGRLFVVSVHPSAVELVHLDVCKRPRVGTFKDQRQKLGPIDLLLTFCVTEKHTPPKMQPFCNALWSFFRPDGQPLQVFGGGDEKNLRFSGVFAAL
jgi:hypothetical protein